MGYDGGGRGGGGGGWRQRAETSGEVWGWRGSCCQSALSLSLTHTHTHTVTSHPPPTLARCSGVSSARVSELCICVCRWRGYVRGALGANLRSHGGNAEISAAKSTRLISSVIYIRDVFSQGESDRTHAVTSSAADHSSVKPCSLQAWAERTETQRLQCVSLMALCRSVSNLFIISTVCEATKSGSCNEPHLLLT